MEIIATIASVIAALAAIITLCFTYKTSRTNIRKKIACKNKKISEIDRRIFLSQSKSVSFLQIKQLEAKKKELQSEIEELRQEL